jgi:hypothetical protein
MSTIFNAKTALSVLTIIGTAGCTEDFCAVHPSDITCKAKVIIQDPGLSVYPQRLVRSKGGNVSIKDEYNANKEVFITLAGTKLSLGKLDKHGALQVVINPEVIAKFKTGHASVIIENAAIQRAPVRMKFYTEPKFTNNAGMQTVWQRNIAKDQPAAISIMPVAVEILDPNTLIALNQFNLKDQGSVVFKNLDRYQFASGRFDPVDSTLYPREVRDSAPGNQITLSSGIAISQNRLIYARKVTTETVSIVPINLSPFYFGSPISNDKWNSLISLKADPKGTLLGAIINAKLQIFAGENLSSPVPLEDLGAGRTGLGVASFGFGDIDGDGIAELAVWHTENRLVSVYSLIKAQFLLNPILSDKLQTRTAAALNGLSPTAVRIADIDSDGVDDVIVANGKQLLIFPSDGNGDYEETIEVPAVGSGVDALGAVSAIAVGKLGDNANAAPSLALVSGETKQIAIVLNQSTE